MKDPRYRRLLGKAIAGQPFEDEFFPQVQLPFELMRRAVPGTRAAGAGNKRNVDFLAGCWHFDPPVGGFLGNDIVAEFPATTENFGNIIGAITPVNTASFAPGLWRMQLAWAMFNWANNDNVSLRFYPFDDLTDSLALDGAVGPAGIHLRGVFGGTGIQLPTQFEFYIPEEWKLAVKCDGGAMADVKEWWVWIFMQSLHVLDGEGATQ